jgi:hypothetical protein
MPLPMTTKMAWVGSLGVSIQIASTAMISGWIKIPNRTKESTAIIFSVTSKVEATTRRF